MGHCGYDNGYIDFNRINNWEDVWRRKIDVLNIPEVARPSTLHNKPDKIMIEASSVADDRHFDSSSHNRDPTHLCGQFVPWARLLIHKNPSTLKLARDIACIMCCESVSSDVERWSVINH